MDYRMVTDTTSTQYALIQQMTVQPNGLLVDSENRIGIALGSYYGSAGDKFTITMTNGYVFQAIMIDEKSDMHTTNGCYDQSGAIIEFVVDMKCLDPVVMQSGTFESLEQFKGTIAKIEKE